VEVVVWSACVVVVMVVVGAVVDSRADVVSGNGVLCVAVVFPAHATSATVSTAVSPLLTCTGGA
jgi:hypothetical protein